MPASPNSTETANPRIRLCEGYEDVFVPELAYVRQGKKVHFLFGDRKLTESVGSDATILESFDQLELVERDGKKLVKDGQWVVEGPYQRSDIKNANGRTYGKKIWERLVADSKSPVQELVRARGMLGHLEHPKDGRTDGKEGAIVTTALKLREDGVVWGQSELLDTPNGQILQEYTRKKVRWGVSSRGNGSVDDTGKVNETDYMVETWDAVMRPSTPGAYPNPVHSSRSEGENVPAPVQENMTAEVKACVSQARELSETALDGLDESAHTKLASKLLALSSQVTALARSESMPASVANDCHDWLTKKLRELSEAKVATQTVDEQINGAIQAVSQGGGAGERQAEAFNRVITSMQRRVSEAVQETEAVRKELAETVAGLQQSEQVAEETRSNVSELTRENGSLRRKLAAATEAIAQLSRTELANPVEEAVEEVIAQQPVLLPKRAALLEAETPEQVEERAIQLLDEIGSGKRSVITEAVPPEIMQRPTLPKGSVVSESVSAPRSASPASTNRGVVLAGKAVARMGVTPS